MKTPFIRSVSIVGLAALGLAACGDSGNGGEGGGAPAEAATMQAEQTDTEKMMDKAKDMANEAMDTAKEMAENITIDTSSVEAFKTSIMNMRESLSDEDKDRMMDAMKNIGKKALDSGEGLMGAAKDMMNGESAEEGILEKFGDQLSGLNFEELLEFANS